MGTTGESDAFPGRILVGEATREWSLRVDEKLAHRLQEEEINKHLDGNRHRNENVRQSYPVAASMQQMVMEEANRKAQLLQQRIEADARIAKEHQKFEMQRAGVKPKEPRMKRGMSHQPALSDELEAGPSTSQSMSSQRGNGAVPRRPPLPHRTAKSYSVDDTPYRDESGSMDNNANLAELEAALGISKEQLHLEKERLLQEEKDAELARQLLNTEIRDPIEIADSELARRLQDREYERYQKSKEKRALRKQMEKMNSSRASYQENNNAPQLNDTYSQPHDSLKGSSLPGNDSFDKHDAPPSTNLNQNDGHVQNICSNQQEDPYYMEPIHASDPAFLSNLNIHYNNNYPNDISNGNNAMGTISSTTSSNTSGNKQYNLNISPGSVGSMEYKRAPPVPPKSHGRPKMAEPENPKMGLLKNTEDKDRNKARCRQM